MADRGDGASGLTPSGGARIQPGWWRYLTWLLLVGVFGWYWFSPSDGQQQATVAYSEFKQDVRDDRVMSVTMRGDRVSGRLRAADANDASEAPDGGARAAAPTSFVSAARAAPASAGGTTNAALLTG
jgi:hypothetical protein